MTQRWGDAMLSYALSGRLGGAGRLLVAVACLAAATGCEVTFLPAVDGYYGPYYEDYGYYDYAYYDDFYYDDYCYDCYGDWYYDDWYYDDWYYSDYYYVDDSYDWGAYGDVVWY